MVDSVILFRITEETKRSQFLAYFSFTSVKSGQGIQFKGGKRIENTGKECQFFKRNHFTFLMNITFEGRKK